MKIDSPQILTPTITGSLLISGSLVVVRILKIDGADIEKIWKREKETRIC